jgi:serine/threonine protein phosphatase 1
MIYCIPDIHGRLDLLDLAVDYITKNFKEGDQLVFLGDYVDRGPESAKVVKTVRDLQSLNTFFRTTALLGNHEQMMMEEMAGWHYNGALETLASYKRTYGEEWWTERFTNDQKWMKTLPYYYQTGDLFFVHANVDQTLPIDEQQMTMLWDRHYINIPLPGKLVVHGHTPLHGHDVREGRINLDGGAIWTGRLNMGIFEDSKLVEVKVFSDK